MTRNELLAAYTIDRDAISSPGKFEGEAIWAPFFHDATLDGCAEELSCMEDGAGQYDALVEISSEARAEFPEIPPCKAFARVTEGDTGFVVVKLLTAQTADALRREYEQEL